MCKSSGKPSIWDSPAFWGTKEKYVYFSTKKGVLFIPTKIYPRTQTVRAQPKKHSQLK
jgi:hypothetical protein